MTPGPTAEGSSGFPEALTTERLRLRRFHADDASWYAEMNADPEVVRHLVPDVPFTRRQSDESLVAVLDHWDQRRFGLWAAERVDTGEPIGFIGLSVPTFVLEILPAVEVGWRLGRRHWGLGFATEGARAALDQGFGVLGLDRVVSITSHDNLRSQAVMARLGLQWDRACVHPRYGLILQVRAISRSDWRRHL